jgi:hypothetical protein
VATRSPPSEAVRRSRGPLLRKEVLPRAPPKTRVRNADLPARPERGCCGRCANGDERGRSIGLRPASPHLGPMCCWKQRRRQLPLSSSRVWLFGTAPARFWPQPARQQSQVGLTWRPLETKNVKEGQKPASHCSPLSFCCRELHAIQLQPVKGGLRGAFLCLFYMQAG